MDLNESEKIHINYMLESPKCQGKSFDIIRQMRKMMEIII